MLAESLITSRLCVYLVVTVPALSRSRNKNRQMRCTELKGMMNGQLGLIFMKIKDHEKVDNVAIYCAKTQSTESKINSGRLSVLVTKHNH